MKRHSKSLVSFLQLALKCKGRLLRNSEALLPNVTQLPGAEVKETQDFLSDLALQPTMSPGELAPLLLNRTLTFFSGLYQFGSKMFWY